MPQNLDLALRIIQIIVSLIQVVTALLTLSGLVVAAVVYALVNHELFPVLQLIIEMKESEEMPGTIHLKLTAENKSKVHIKVNQEKGVWLQILTYEVSQMEKIRTFSNWVPFKEASIKPGGPKPRGEFPDPMRIMETTTNIEAGECIRIEFLHRPLPPRRDLAIACGFQVNAIPIKDELRQDGHILLAEIAEKLEKFTHNPTDRFTTTAWLLMSGSSKDVSSVSHS
jgi:hypothetical protein